MAIERPTSPPPQYESLELVPLTGAQRPEGDAATVQHAPPNRAPISKYLEVGLYNAALVLGATGAFSIAHAFTHASHSDRLTPILYGTLEIWGGAALGLSTYALAANRSGTRQDTPV